MDYRIGKLIALSLVTCVLMSGYSSPCFAGAWTCNAGKMYNRLAFNYYYADEQFDNNGEKEEFGNSGEFKDYNLQYYMEYGISDELTLISSLYYKAIKKEDNTLERKTYGIGDIDIAARFKLIEGSWGILSTQGLVKIPEAYNEDDHLPLGNGQYDFEFKVLYGRSLWPFIPGYFNTEVGYRFRAEDPADELRYLVEFGMDITQKIYGRIKLDGIKGMNNADNVHSSNGNPTMTYNYDLGKLDMALGLKLSPKWAVEVGYIPEIYGENTSAGAAYSLALSFRL